VDSSIIPRLGTVDCSENLDESRRYRSGLMNRFLRKYKKMSGNKVRPLPIIASHR
jgi:hypothetical protein